MTDLEDEESSLEQQSLDLLEEAQKHLEMPDKARPGKKRNRKAKQNDMEMEQEAVEKLSKRGKQRKKGDWNGENEENQGAPRQGLITDFFVKKKSPGCACACRGGCKARVSDEGDFCLYCRDHISKDISHGDGFLLEDSTHMTKTGIYWRSGERGPELHGAIVMEDPGKEAQKMKEIGDVVRMARMSAELRTDSRCYAHNMRIMDDLCLRFFEKTGYGGA